MKKKALIPVRAFDDKNIDFIIVCNSDQVNAIKKARAKARKNYNIDSCDALIPYLMEELERQFTNIKIYIEE